MSEPEIDSAALIAHLTAERDKAREEAGVYKYRMEHYEREMYIYLRKLNAIRGADATEEPQ